MCPQIIEVLEVHHLQQHQLETYVQTHLDIMPILQTRNAKVSFDVPMEHPMSYLVPLVLSIILTPFNADGLQNINVLELEVIQQQQQLTHIHLLQQLQEVLLL